MCNSPLDAALRSPFNLYYTGVVKKQRADNFAYPTEMLSFGCFVSNVQAFGDDLWVSWFLLCACASDRSTLKAEQEEASKARDNEQRKTMLTCKEEKKRELEAEKRMERKMMAETVAHVSAPSSITMLAPF